VTAGGLVFAPSQSDKTLYAYDAVTGKTVWAKQLPAAPEGVPAVYESGGREYLVICARDTDVPRGAPLDPNKPVVQGYYVFALAR